MWKVAQVFLGLGYFYFILGRMLGSCLYLIIYILLQE
nr:MAG TPA: hypothetical protein [Crassvirales sp.]